jgi:hypothetical protein
MSVTSTEVMLQDALGICWALGIEVKNYDIFRDYSKSLPRNAVAIVSESGHAYLYGPDWLRGKMHFEEVPKGVIP